LAVVLFSSVWIHQNEEKAVMLWNRRIESEKKCNTCSAGGSSEDRIGSMIVRSPRNVI
jgi:hypothetical protein